METMTASVPASPQPRAEPDPDIPSIPFSQLKSHGAPWCQDHLRRLVKRGEFPRPVRVSQRKVLWTPRQLREWREAKVREAA